MFAAGARRARCADHPLDVAHPPGWKKPSATWWSCSDATSSTSCTPRRSHGPGAGGRTSSGDCVGRRTCVARAWPSRPGGPTGSNGPTSPAPTRPRPSARPTASTSAPPPTTSRSSSRCGRSARWAAGDPATSTRRALHGARGHVRHPAGALAAAKWPPRSRCGRRAAPPYGVRAARDRCPSLGARRRQYGCLPLSLMIWGCCRRCRRAPRTANRDLSLGLVRRVAAAGRPRAQGGNSHGERRGGPMDETEVGRIASWVGVDVGKEASRDRRVGGGGAAVRARRQKRRGRDRAAARSRSRVRAVCAGDRPAA
jgi:hypothetical protein